MQAIILAAGRGIRMEKLTKSCPKPLLVVGNKTLIEHRILALAVAGITNIVINVSYLREFIIQHLGDGKHLGVNITYSVEDAPLETAGGIIQALPLLSREPFWVVNADIVTDFIFTQNVELKAALAHLILVNNPKYNKAGDFAYFKDKQQEQKRLTYSGIGYYHPDLFKGKSPGKQELRPILEAGFVGKLISTQHYQGYWQDVGTPERVIESEQGKLIWENCFVVCLVCY